MGRKEATMPRRKSDREKKMGGTFRPDRAAREAPKAVPEAQATLTTITVKLADAQKQLAGLKGSKNAKARARVENTIRVLTDDVELAMEALNKAMNHAAQQAAAPSIRPGLELLSYDDHMNASPPLNEDEELEYLRVGPNDEELIVRRRAAALPLTVKDAELIKSILAHMEYLAGQRNLTATEAARLKLFREHLAYFEAQQD
jgi:hypothetical protein